MGMTDGEVFEAMGAALVERGLVTASDVQADLVTQPFYKPAVQVDKTIDATNSPADEVDPQAAELDAAVFAPPSSPDVYRFMQPSNGLPDATQLAQAQATAQAFYDIGLPVSIASHADKLFSEAMANPPNAEQLEASRQQAHVTLNRQFGADTPKAIAVAQAEFARMAKSAPHLVELAERSGLGNHPILISQLYFNALSKNRGPK